MFAAKMMSKMGWKPGQGLGKNNQGRVYNVVGSLKNDTIGVGVHDNLAMSWEDMFNKAANSIKIESSSKSKKIAIKVQKEEKKNVEYNGFVKSSADASNMCNESDDDEDPKHKKYMYHNRMAGKLKRLNDFDSGKDSNIKLVLQTLEEKKRKSRKSHTDKSEGKQNEMLGKSIEKSGSIKKTEKRKISSKSDKKKTSSNTVKVIDKELKRKKSSKKDKSSSTKRSKKASPDSSDSP